MHYQVLGKEEGDEKDSTLEELHMKEPVLPKKY